MALGSGRLALGSGRLALRSGRASCDALSLRFVFQLVLGMARLITSWIIARSDSFSEQASELSYDSLSSEVAAASFSVRLSLTSIPLALGSGRLALTLVWLALGSGRLTLTSVRLVLGPGRLAVGSG